MPDTTRALRLPRAVFAASLSRARQNVAFALLVLAVFGVYWFLVSAGTDPWPVYGVYHDLQADGFLKGRLSLALEPAPELLRAKNPYDPVNMKYWSLDASYFDGRYYMYWGPVPALFQAVAKLVLRIRRPVGDQYLTLFFLCVAFFCGAVLIRRLARRIFPALPAWFVVLGTLTFAFANPTPHAATTASTYHTAIVAGQAWLVAGLLFAFDAVWYAGSPNARPRRLWFSGICWALAIGSRVTLAPAIAALMLLTAVAEGLASERRVRRAFAVALVLGVPVALGSFGLLLYNYLRFHDWLEFGSRIQLSGFPTFRIALGYVPLNLYSYSLRPWLTSCSFPFLFQQWHPELDFPKFMLPIPPGYNSPEPVVGFLVALPLVWLAPSALLLAPRPREGLTRRTRAYWFCLLSFGVAASVTGLVAIGVYGSTMRYLSDVTFGLVLLALLAVFGLRTHGSARYAGRPISALTALLAGATIVIGLLLGYQGYNGHFHHYNPELDRKLVQALSLCDGDDPRLPEWMVEPR